MFHALVLGLVIMNITDCRFKAVAFALRACCKGGLHIPWGMRTPNKLKFIPQIVLTVPFTKTFVSPLKAVAFSLRV